MKVKPMKKNYHVLLEQNDKIRVSPCNGCRDSVGCCGCGSGRKYNADMNIFKDACVYEEAIVLAEYNQLVVEKAEIEKKVNAHRQKLKAMLPEDVCSLLNL